MSAAAARALAAALLARAGEGALLRRHDRRPWASITFEGERHRLVLELASANVPTFGAGLADVEIPLPGQFVADLVLEESEDAGGDLTRLVVVALTLTEA